VVSANEFFFISTDPRSATTPLSSGQALKQQTATFSNAWLNGTGVVQFLGSSPHSWTDVTIGVVTTDGVGKHNHSFGREQRRRHHSKQSRSPFTYSVAANGRTTFAGGTGTHQPVLYLVDLNKGFLVDTGTNAGTGFT